MALRIARKLIDLLDWPALEPGQVLGADDFGRPTALESLVDGTFDAAADVAFQARVEGDAGARFRINADGKLEWGNGGGTFDVALYRGAVDQLRSDDQFYSARSAVSSPGFGAGITGDTLARWIVLADGKLEWGPGNAARDTNLYRSAADTLKTDDTFEVAGGSGRYVRLTGGTALWETMPSASSTAIFVGVSGDVQTARFTVDASGVMKWGDGTLTGDVILFRSAADILSTQDRIRVNRALSTDYAFDSLVASESERRFALRSDGMHEWGDGTSARDTNLYRFAANELKTDDTLRVGNAWAVHPNGYVAFSEASDPGLASVNTVRQFARDNGAGKTQLCVQFPTGAVQVLATEP
jgi:hypothetical protein